MDPHEIDLLERRLSDVDRALEENAMRLSCCAPHSAQHNDYRRQEVEHERRDLTQQRAQTERKLTQAREQLNKSFQMFRQRKHDPEQQLRTASLDALEAERRESILRWVQRLEAEGDYRQARIWRAELLTVRAQVAREYGFV